ncbi:MAG: D-alanine--D-alanine ligase [Lachnospiraceae bacterium]
MNIVVLAGGLSTERDVSLVTGAGVTQALRKNGHQVLLMDVFLGYKEPGADLQGIFEHADKVDAVNAGIQEIAPDIESIKAMRTDKSANFFGPNVIKLCRMADIVFLGLHGSNGEDGRIQAAFDLFGIKYTGTGHLSSAVAMDKEISKKFFVGGGIPTPKGVIAIKGEKNLTLKEADVPLPCIVKPCCGGSSIGCTIVRREEEYGPALEEAFQYEDRVVVEQFIKGREFSVGVMQGKAMPVIEIAPVVGFYDYKNKYKAGSAVETCPAEIPDHITKEMQTYAEKVFQCLNFETYARMDFLLSENNNIYCLEANTLPGMTPTSLLPQEAAVLGADYPALCQEIVRISMEKYGA